LLSQNQKQAQYQAISSSKQGSGERIPMADYALSNTDVISHDLLLVLELVLLRTRPFAGLPRPCRGGVQAMAPCDHRCQLPPPPPLPPHACRRRRILLRQFPLVDGTTTNY
ncbi:hypothetical protein BAE44_0005720, partial [Dichanthelium oligosanthes]